jgi:hypothetical protein
MVQQGRQAGMLVKAEPLNKTAVAASAVVTAAVVTAAAQTLHQQLTVTQAPPNIIQIQWQKKNP